jgi:caffeoyl-CoA O-methyltransferase
MFHAIRKSVLDRMQYLETLDSADRVNGTSHWKRLRQIPPETGRFLAFLAAGAPAGAILEIGTSAGYSTLWLTLACAESGRIVHTIEILAEKAALARETFRAAGVEGSVRLIEGDARPALGQFSDIAFCFLDAEKELYGECYDLVVPRLVRGGLFVADNAVSHREELAAMLDRVLRDERVDAVVVPIGKGELVCRKL